jgi:hypothetical protein
VDITSEAAFVEAFELLEQNCNLVSTAERVDVAAWNLNRALFLLAYGLLRDLHDLKSTQVALHDEIKTLRAEVFLLGGGTKQ